MKTKQNSIETIFTPNSIYQVSLLSTSFVQDISFPKDFETAKLVAAFKVTSSPNGFFEPPKYYVIYTLSTLTEVIDFINLSGVTAQETTLLKVSEQIQISFSPRKRYEFFAAWLKPEKEHLLQEFFVASEPIKQSYGRPAPDFKLPFKSIHDTDVPGVTFAPQMAGIVEWDSDDDVGVLMSHPEFAAKAALLFEEAIERMEMILGQLI